MFIRCMSGLITFYRFRCNFGRYNIKQQPWPFTRRIFVLADRIRNNRNFIVSCAQSHFVGLTGLVGEAKTVFLLLALATWSSFLAANSMSITWLIQKYQPFNMEWVRSRMNIQLVAFPFLENDLGGVIALELGSIINLEKFECSM